MNCNDHLPNGRDSRHWMQTSGGVDLEWKHLLLQLMVEAVGVEPTSAALAEGASTSLVG